MWVVSGWAGGRVSTHLSSHGRTAHKPHVRVTRVPYIPLWLLLIGEGTVVVFEAGEDFMCESSAMAVRVCVQGCAWVYVCVCICVSELCTCVRVCVRAHGMYVWT